MEKNQIDELIKELNELSDLEEQNIDRMKEIAKVLVAYYMWWKPWNAKSVGNKPQEKTLDKDIASNVAI